MAEVPDVGDIVVGGGVVGELVVGKIVVGLGGKVAGELVVGSDVVGELVVGCCVVRDDEVGSEVGDGVGFLVVTRSVWSGCVYLGVGCAVGFTVDGNGLPVLIIAVGGCVGVGGKLIAVIITKWCPLSLLT